MSVQAELLREIEAFLAQRGDMAETTFGRLAVNDGKLVGRLRSGRNMTLATIERTRRFLRDQAVASRSTPTEGAPPSSAASVAA
jgi:hypothetical protein